MRWLGLISAVLAGTVMAQAPGARPAADPRAAQISAASADAITALVQQVESVPLGDRLTIGTITEKTATQARLRTALESARQVGGPRWLDEQTAQVRIEIEGAAVATILRQIISDNPTTSPVTLEQIEPALRALVDRQFTASGSSAAASVLEDVQPAGADAAWSTVAPEARREAIASARKAAAESVINSTRNVTLPDGKPLAEVMDKPQSPVRKELEQYLLDRPVTDVQFRDDKQVEVTLSAPPTETFETVREAVEKTDGAPKLDEQQWSQVREKFVQSVAPATGIGQLPQNAVVIPEQLSVRLPQQAPIWAREMIDAVGSAEGASTRLKTRHAAEQDALAKLRQQVLDLPLTPELKLGDAAQQDPEIAAAVDRALARARAYKSDYFPDGRVIVRSSLELRDVWDQLQER
jgi:hypothetical protein